MRTTLWRRRRLLAALLGLVVALAVVGALAAPGPHYHLARGQTCVFHGWRAWASLREHHPEWTGWHLWRAARTCHPAPWRY
jgi:hypothetical protein